MNLSKMRITGGMLMALILALALPMEVKAQGVYESTEESVSIGSNNIGADLEFFAEFEQDSNLVRAYGSLTGQVNYFGNSTQVLFAEVLSEVQNGQSTNEAYLEIFGQTIVDEDESWQWQWSDTQTAGPWSLTYSFPLIWGLTVDISAGLGAELNMGVTIGAGVGMAGLDGSVNSYLDAYVSASLTANLWVGKVRVALQCNLTLFDYGVTMQATISLYGANVLIEATFNPISVSVDLVLQYKYWTFWSGWSSWETATSWNLFNWSAPSFSGVIFEWEATFWTQEPDEVTEYDVSFVNRYKNNGRPSPVFHIDPKKLMCLLQGGYSGVPSKGRAPKGAKIWKSVSPVRAR